MFNVPPAGSLPVSATVPNQNMFIPNLPTNIPFQPQVQLQPRQYPFLQPATGFFLAELQGNAGKNALRTFAFNLFSSNQYNNKDFNEFLLGVIEYAEMLAYTQRVQPEQACQAAAAEMASIATCVFAKRYPELLRMGPNGTVQEVERWIERLSQIRNEIHRFQSQPGHQQPQQQMGWQQAPGMTPPPGWGGTPMPQQPYPPQQQQVAGWQQPYPPQQQPGMWQHPHQQMQGMGQQPYPPQQVPWQQRAMTMPGMPGQQHQSSLYNRHQQPGMTMQQGMGLFQTPPQQINPVAQGVRGSSLKPRPNPAVMERMGDHGYQDFRSPEQVQQDQYRAQQIGGQVNQFAQQVNSFTDTARTQAQQHLADWDLQTTRVDPEFNEPTPPPQEERSYDHIVTNDQEAKPAHLSGWEATYSPKRPYKMAYDPSTHVKFHVRNREGEVTELVEEYKEDMDYLRHETNQSIKGKLPSLEDGKVIPNMDLLTTAQPLPPTGDLTDEEREEKLKDIQNQSETLLVTDTFTTYGEQYARTMCELFLVRHGMENQWTQRAIEYNHQTVVPYYNQKVGDVELKEILKITHELESIDDYVAQLRKLNSNVDFPTYLLTELVEDSTRVLNEALTIGLGTDWRVDSILEDWVDLKREFISDMGQEQGAALLAELEKQCATAIITGGRRVVLGEELEALFLKGGALYQFAAEKDKLVVLTTLTSETHVPWRAADVSLALENGVGVVLPSKLPNLHGAVLNIARRADQSVQHFHRNYIVTADNVKLEIHRGILGKDYYLLKLVE